MTRRVQGLSLTLALLVQSGAITEDEKRAYLERYGECAAKVPA